MNRVLKKTLHISFVAVVLAIFLSLCVFAEYVEKELFVLDSEKNISIAIEYDTETPDIILVSPDGKEYPATSLEPQDTGKVLYLKLPSAMAGVWKIKYDLKSNQNVNASYAPYVTAFGLSKLEYTLVNDYEIKVDFRVEHLELKDFRYKIMLATLDENGNISGTKELCSGVGYIGRDEEVYAGLYNVSSFSDYRVVLEVENDSNGALVFDSFVAREALSYVNPNTDQALDGFSVEVNLTEGFFTVDWSDSARYDISSYIIEIVNNVTAERVYFNEFDSSITSTSVATDIGSDSYTFTLYYKNYDGILSSPAVVFLDVKMSDIVSVVSEEQTTSVEAKLEYDASAFPEGVFATVEINDNSEEIFLLEKGEAYISLDSMDNNISLFWRINDNILFKKTYYIYSDRLAPTLLLYEITGVVKTAEKEYVLTGATDAGCSVKAGDKSVKVDENGLFNITLPLENGRNVFDISAISKSGIVTKQSVIINKVSQTEGATFFTASNIVIIIVILAVVLAVVLLLVIFIASYNKRVKSDRRGAVLSLVRNIFITALVPFSTALIYSLYQVISRIIVLSSENFVDIVMESIIKAGSLVEEKEIWVIASIVFFALVLLSALAVLILTKLKNTVPKPKHEKKEKLSNKPVKKSETKAIIYCSKCGSPNSLENEFCVNCGEKLNKD